MASGKWLGRLALGLAAGAAGTAAMNGYWMLLARLPKSNSQTESEPAGEEPTTVVVARRALRQFGVRHPSSRTRKIGGTVVHWSYGSLWGAVAALADEAGVPIERGGGQLLGAGLWAFGDLWLLYQMGYARHPRDYPATTHAKALGAHLAYGAGVWASLRAMQQLAVLRQRRRHARQLRRAA